MNSLFARHNLATAFALVCLGLLPINRAHAQGSIPTIIAPPHSQTVIVGMNATFHVAAFGRKSPVTYQWRFNNAPILNATNNSYTRTNVQLFHAGNYSVVVMNAFGSVQSLNALLTVDQSRLYWDVDGATPGPGGLAPSGSWADASWSPSPDGSSSTTNWVPTSTAFFAAGGSATDFYDVALEGDQVVSGINFEEGDVSIVGSGTLSLTGDGALFVAEDRTARISSAITGDGSLIKTGNGRLELDGENSYFGDTLVSEGTLALGGFFNPKRPAGTKRPGSANGPMFLPGRIPDGSAVTVFEGAVLDLFSSNETIGSLSGSGHVDLGEGSLTVGANNISSFFDGSINGSGSVEKIGFGTLTLAGESDLFDFLLNGGALEIANPDALGFDSIIVGSGFSEIISSVFELNLSNPIVLQDGATASLLDFSESRFEVSGLISGDGSLNLEGDDFGLIVLSGNNDFAGGVTFTGGTLELGNSQALGTGTFTISGGTPSNPVVLKAAMDLVSEGGIGNPVSLEQVLTIDSANQIEFYGPMQLDGSSREIRISDGGLNGSSGPIHSISGTISGSGGQLVKSGPGTLVLSGDNDYTGSTLVRMGTLQVENFEGSATGSGAVTVGTSQSGSLVFPQGILSGNGTISGPVSVFGTISPGSSPGQIATGSQTWNSRGHYLWEINDAGGGGKRAVSAAGGRPHDLINIAGTLTIAASPAAPFNIDITTLTLNNTPGDLFNFDEGSSYAWLIARTTDGITPFNPDAVRINPGTLPVSRGSFSLSVENDGLDLVLHFDPDAAAPGLVFTFPADDSHTDQSVITIRGTSSDNLGVAAVFYQIGEGPFMMAEGTTNWSAQIPLTLGTNIVTIKSVDTTGNESMPVSRVFILDETAPLTIEIIGLGSVTPNLNGQLLVVGQTYTVTAVPGPTNAFSDWSGGVESSEAELTFEMQPDLVLRATFVPASLSTGVYNGLFYENERVRHESSGFFTFKLSSSGTFSGKILIDGGTHRISGGFGGNQVANLQVVRSGKSTLNISLMINPVSDEVSGQVVTPDWTSRILGDLAFADSSTEPAPQAGKYNMTIPGEDDDDESTLIPLGDGFGRITVNPRGRVLMNGRLSDNVRTTHSTGISKNGVWPFYDTLYGGKGSILGWITFTNRIAFGNQGENSAAGNVITNELQNSLSGNLSWIKMGGAGGQFFRGGFTNPVVTYGSTYVRPESGSRVLDFSQGLARFQDGNLAEPFTVSLTLSDRNILTASEESPNRLRLRFTLSNGYLSGTFTHPATGKRMLVRSVVLQQSNEARGYFVGTDETGSVRLRSDDD